MQIVETIPEPPWYRQFWPWAILSIPIATILACAVLITLAIKSDDGLVSDDYYKEGLAINRRNQLEQAASDRGISATLQFAGDQLRVIFPTEVSVSESIAISLIHNTLQHRDVQLVLHKTTDGVFQGALPKPVAGSYTIALESESRDWKLVKRVTVTGDTVLELAPTEQ